MNNIQLLTKASQIVDELARLGPLSAAELAKAASEPRPSVYRIVAALQEIGVVRAAEDGRVELGTALLRWSDAAVESFVDRRGLRKEMRWVRDQLGMNVYFCVPHHDGVLCLDRVSPVELRNFYAACDVLVVPSISTRTFREPWGLVVNEAMNRGLPVIASDAVGAAAGGLVRDGETGLVVPAGDSPALAAAIGRLAGDPGLRARLGAAAAAEVRAFSHGAWAHGFSQALASLGLSLGPLVACTDHP